MERQDIGTSRDTELGTVERIGCELVAIGVVGLAVCGVVATWGLVVGAW